MKTDRYTKTVLTLIAVFLGIIALRPILEPTKAYADSVPVHQVTQPKYQLHFLNKASMKFMYTDPTSIGGTAVGIIPYEGGVLILKQVN